MILAFGSGVSAKLHPRSDVDIAVSCKNPNLSMEEFSDLLFELQRLFPQNEVDLAIINWADPLFLKKILERCEILYGTKSELARLKIYAFKRYIDHRKYFDLEEKFAQKFIARHMGDANK
jgi:predicted nucleotidyltransferase